MDNLKRVGLIMAGGNGTRFWPSSRSTYPKQFLNLTGKDTLLNETIARMNMVIDIEDIYIIGNINHKDLMIKTLPSNFKKENILYEPLARNTAPCIVYSAFYLKQKYGNAIMCISPADHYITDNSFFSKTMIKGICEAERSSILVTLGIKPTYPATGYGYINAIESKKHGIYDVEKFVEKPNLQTAESYIKSNNYFWNSGLFIWQIDSILNAAKSDAPSIFKPINSLFAKYPFSNIDLESTYKLLPKISVDYAVLEKNTHIHMIPLISDWNDVGSWEALSSIIDSDEDGNIFKGNIININSKNTTIMSSKKIIATIDVDNLILVETEDAILICKRESSQKVKEIVKTLTNNGNTDLI